MKSTKILDEITVILDEFNEILDEFMSFLDEFTSFLDEFNEILDDFKPGGFSHTPKMPNHRVKWTSNPPTAAKSERNAA